MKMTNEIFLEKLRKVHADKYIPLELYSSTHVKLLIKCNCGNTFGASPNKLLAGRGCPDCGRKRTTEASKKSSDTFSDYVTSETNGEYKLVSKYTGYYNKVNILHISCGTTYPVSPSKFKYGTRCPVCSVEAMRKKKTHSHEMFLDKFKELNLENKFNLLSEYTNTRTLLDVQCKKCSHQYSILPNNLTSNLTKCPNCSNYLPSKSKNVILIEALLTKFEIPFIQEVRFDDCRNIRPLPFDFAIPNLNLLIEYDGKQHFHAVASQGGLKNHLMTLANDKIKNNFCIENDFALLRIPYTLSSLKISKIITVLRTFNDQSSDVLYEHIEETGGIFIHKNIIVDKD